MPRVLNSTQIILLFLERDYWLNEVLVIFLKSSIEGQLKLIDMVKLSEYYEFLDNHHFNELISYSYANTSALAMSTNFVRTYQE